MVEDERKEVEDIRTSEEFKARSSAFFATVVLGGTVSIIILLCLFEPPIRPITTPTFCCPHVLEEILLSTNLSVDPCHNAYEHTCSRRATSGTRYLESQASILSSDPVRGFPATRAGRAIAAYYRACLGTWMTNASVGQISAEAVLKYTKITSPMAPESLLQLILELPLKYSLPSVIDARVKTVPGEESSTILVLRFPATSRLSSVFDSQELAEVKTDIVDTINDVLTSAVGVPDFDKFIQDHSGSQSREETSTVLSLLSLTTRVTTKEWVEVLSRLVNYDTLVGISGVPIRILNTTLDKFLDPAGQPQTTAVALISSSMHLASRIRTRARYSQERNSFCELHAQELRPLWIQDKIGHLSTPAQDIGIRSTYLTLVGVVLRKVGNMMTVEELEKLASTLNNVRLLLPSEVARQDDVMPSFDFTFAQAYLEGREYMFRTSVYRTRTLGIGVDFIADVEKQTTTSRGRTLTVPLIIYRMLQLTNNTDPLVAMPTLGVPLARAIWEMIFSVKWNNSFSESFSTRRECLVQSVKEGTWLPSPMRPSELSWLSLDTCAEACRSDHWSDRLEGIGPWNLTRAQVFYMIYVTYHHCKPALGRVLPLATYGDPFANEAGIPCRLRELLDDILGTYYGPTEQGRELPPNGVLRARRSQC
ncbi:hypothetical protein HPB50_010066 [Hyalomma asiaticum]|uniref:Uncharacterized protein n=1 Tax=Hyalomma asiaticum TaxID=266040 RepID=A0ACB7S1Q7_HYAAI|nr:hypothetical protein HPB50_010066 [Hyalomma asiaticum]